MIIIILSRIIPTKIENRNAIKFLKNAALLPIYLDSSVKVIIPTKVNEEIRVPTWAYPAPFKSNVWPREKATKVGIIVIEPIISASIIPKKPELFPSILDIVSVVKNESSMPTVIIIQRNWGIIFSSDFSPKVIAFFVFDLSFKKEIINKIKDKLYKRIYVIKTS